MRNPITGKTAAVRLVGAKETNQTASNTTPTRLLGFTDERRGRGKSSRAVQTEHSRQTASQPT